MKVTRAAGRLGCRRRQGDRDLVRLENVGLRYGHGPEILKDVSFKMGPGEFRFLTGPSGAGKSSLLRLLFLALRPTRGLVNLFGKDVTAVTRRELPALRRRIGVVFQDFRLLDHLTTYDNVALPLRIVGAREPAYRSDVMELLSWVGLADQARAYPPVLSGGEKQRAAIARAVIAKPEVLLADEPTGNVDPALANRLLRLFVELNRLGTTVLIATHDTHLIQQARLPVFRLERGELRMAA
jgi:cell division transport system ATP-binding protein